MVRPKDPWNSFALYVDAETFDFRSRVTSKFFCCTYCTWTVYHSTGQYLYCTYCTWTEHHSTGQYLYCTCCTWTVHHSTGQYLYCTYCMWTVHHSTGQCLYCTYCTWTVHHSTGQCLYFSLLNSISQYNFLIGVYTWIAYQGIKEIMKSNKEMYSALNFTALCYVIVLLLAVLQWH